MKGERLDQAKEWQRLSRLYFEKSDAELSELSHVFGDLTEVAQQVLRDELKRRSLPEPRTALSQPAPEGGRDSGTAPGKWDDNFGSSIINPGLPDEDDAEGGEQTRADYSWKVVLCECDEREDASDVMAVLDQAGIRSWYDGPKGTESWMSYGPRVLVAADELESAQLVLQKPIPQEIRDQNRTKAPDFETPCCEECGAADPLLESSEPSNAWRCEECGAVWTDPISEDRILNKEGQE
jgi:hypothetical protein